ncbi:MAG TPA: isoaspartyl peptidase/L-asparaginase [Gammaproteobacteria bacterium]
MAHARRSAPSVWALAIHGGAGFGGEEAHGAEQDAAIRAELAAVLEAGARMLASGAPALDAVEDAVRRLEDCPLFNAGRGAAFNERGEHELEASIMDGRTLAAGAVAVLRGIKNPVFVARLVMERSPHVFLQGEGAAAFAARHGIERVGDEYFRTERRLRALHDAQRAAVTGPPGDIERSPPPPDAGTVGAVARDVDGNLAAATSTGGLTNKAPGRVGDSSIIGAGTYASNASCAVSCTGHGEYFIRATAARDVAALVEYGGLDLAAAVDRVIRSRVAALGGQGGAIAVDRAGYVACAFNTPVMLRGRVTATSPPAVGIRAETD